MPSSRFGGGTSAFARRRRRSGRRARRRRNPPNRVERSGSEVYPDLVVRLRETVKTRRKGKSCISASRKGKRRAAAVRATARGAGVRHRGRRTRDRGACQRGGTRARSAMSALSALEKRLTALVPTTWTDASAPPDQRSLFELLAETAATTLRSSSAEVKEAQRSLEDVMLRVTCGGWAGPAVRVTAANVLANLFFVGNEVALYSCVNELVAVAFADDDKKASGLSMARASKENVRRFVFGHLSSRAAKRIGALDALTRLANKGHVDAMRGAAGGVVAAADRLLRRAPERAAAADGSPKGARAVRRAALRTVGAIVSSTYVSSSSYDEESPAGNDTRRSARPLRPETRVAAAKLLLAAVRFDASSRADLLGADAGAVAAACVALGALATSPGGFDLWTDPAETPAGPSASLSLGDAVASTLFSLLDHDDDAAAAAAAAALGKLAAARLRVKTPEERREEAARQTSAALRNGGEGASSSGDGDASGGGRSTTTKTSTFGASFFSSSARKRGDAAETHKNKNAAEKKAEAELAAAKNAQKDATRALDLERPGGMALWDDTVRKCFAAPVFVRARRDAESLAPSRKKTKSSSFATTRETRASTTKARRRFNAGIAEAWTEFVREASRAHEAPLPKHALVDLAEAALRAFAPGAGASLLGSDSPLAEVREDGALRARARALWDEGGDPAHARLCAAHVVRHGALPHLDESGRRALTERLMELLAPGGARDGRERSGAGDGDDDAGGFPEALPRAGETKQKQTFFRFSSNDACPPSASATLLCCVAALQASGRVDGELFDTARSALFTSASALECPRDAARAVGALASAAPERAAALLRDATARARVFLSTHQSAFSANKGHLDPADHASARLSARVAAVLVAEADAFELGLPVRDVADAARAAFALATLTLPKRTTKMDAEDVSNETIFRREKNENDALSITRAFAWETVASALAFFAANRDLFARDEASRLETGLDVAAVRDALAEALDPLGLIAAVAETESEKEKAKAADKEKASRAASATSAASRLASLSMFSPSKKRGSAAEPSATTTRNANAKKNVAGSSSYGSATADSHSPASSLPGSPRRNGGHSRNDSSLSQSAESAHSMKKKNAWAPAAELRLRAAAADAVAPFALFSRSENAPFKKDAETARRDALPLLRDALSCACHPVPVLGSSWPADPETANAAATLRLRALEAFIAAPAFMFDSAERRVDDDEKNGDASLGAFDAAVGACAALPESDLPLPNADHSDHSDHSTYVSSSPEHFLRRALNPADAPLGPWHGEENDAASGSLRRFEGAADAPPTSPWRLSCRPNSSSEPFFLREEDTGFAAGLGATLRFARARALARVAAESPARAPAVLAATAAEAAAAANGEDAFSSGSVFFAAGPAPAAGNPRDLLSPKPFSSADDSLSGGAVTTSDRPASPLGSPATRANGRHRRAPSGGGGSGGLFAFPGSMGGSAKAEEKRKLDAATRAERAASSLTSACVASLAVAEAMAASFERKRSSHARRRDGDADEKDATDVAKRKETVFRNLRLETASSLAEVAAAVSGARFAGAAHWRAAAELEAAAASIRDDAARRRRAQGASRRARELAGDTRRLSRRLFRRVDESR